MEMAVTLTATSVVSKDDCGFYDSTASDSLDKDRVTLEQPDLPMLAQQKIASREELSVYQNIETTNL